MDWISWKEPSQFRIAWCLFVSWGYSGLVSVLCLLLATFGKRVCVSLCFVYGCVLVSFYEEVAYRGFALAYLVPREMSLFL